MPKLTPSVAKRAVAVAAAVGHDFLMMWLIKRRGRKGPICDQNGFFAAISTPKYRTG